MPFPLVEIMEWLPELHFPPQVPATGAAGVSHLTGPAALATASAPAAYPAAELYERGLLLTEEYLLDVFVAEAGDEAPHVWDWVYHDDSNTTRPAVWVRPAEAAAAVPAEAAAGAGPGDVFAAAPEGSGYEHLSGLSVYNCTEGAGAEIVFNAPPPAPAYEDYVGRPAGWVSYSVPMPAHAHAASWAPAADAAMDAVLRLEYNFTDADYATRRWSKVYFVLDGPLAPLPAAVPTGLSTWVYGDGLEFRLEFRLYDATRQAYLREVIRKVCPLFPAAVFCRHVYARRVCRTARPLPEENPPPPAPGLL